MLHIIGGSSWARSASWSSGQFWASTTMKWTPSWGRSRSSWANSCDTDKDVRGRHLPKILPRLVGQELVLAHKMIKPQNWTALDMVATGIDSQSYDVAEVVREIYDPEEKRLSWQRGQQGIYTTLRERCEVSGYEDFIPTVTESKKGIRLARGPLQKRLKAEIARDKRSVRAESALHWRFKGHLQEQARIQVALGTIHGSWTSVVSELDGFAMFN